MDSILVFWTLIENRFAIKEEYTQAIESETKEQRGGFLGMLSGILGTDLLGYMLAGKGLVAIRQGKSEVVRTRTCGVIKAGD